MRNDILHIEYPLNTDKKIYCFISQTLGKTPGPNVERNNTYSEGIPAMDMGEKTKRG